MFLKRLFYASASILMLALAYHLGATNAGAQAPGNAVVAVVPPDGAGGVSGNGAVVTANGDIYASSGGSFAPPYRFIGNVFSSATPANTTSFGALKAKYR